MHSDERARSNGKSQATDNHCQLVHCRVDELRPHPSYVRHHLSVSASQLSALAAHGSFTLQEPPVITRDRRIIDGYARLELARRQGQRSILCIEYDLTDEQALRWLIQSRHPYRGLNAYLRILMASDLEPDLQEEARRNQQAGARNKGSSKLTTVKTVDVRSEIAAVAGASTGNVTKVTQLRRTAHPSVEEALRAGEISIHKAWQWRNESPETQLENLRRRRLERGISRKARTLVAEHQAAILPSAPHPIPFHLLELVSIVSGLSNMSTDESSEFGTVVTAILDVPGKGIYLTKELVQALRSQ
jgi:hypothetical protein